MSGLHSIIYVTLSRIVVVDFAVRVCASALYAATVAPNCERNDSGENDVRLLIRANGCDYVCYVEARLLLC